MQLRYSFRLDPTPRQRVARAFGCAPVVFNDALAARRQAHADGLPFISDGDLSKRVITEAKQRPDRVWLGEVSAVVLQQALADACMAYRNFFASLSGKRKGPKVAAPRFRSRRDQRQAIRFTRNARFEDLAVNGLARTRLAKGVHDAGWSAFTAMLEYKAKLYGRTFARIDRFFPSSKLCSVCGTLAEQMPPAVREWDCSCGAHHDRDVNAAINILAAGRAERLNASGGQVRPPGVVARPDERGSLRGAA